MIEYVLLYLFYIYLYIFHLLTHSYSVSKSKFLSRESEGGPEIPMTGDKKNIYLKRFKPDFIG
jgi:hypothetical protein